MRRTALHAWRRTTDRTPALAGEGDQILGATLGAADPSEAVVVDVCRGADTPPSRPDKGRRAQEIGPVFRPYRAGGQPLARLPGHPLSPATPAGITPLLDSSSFAVVERHALVLDLGDLRQHAEAVGEAGRHPELAEVVAESRSPTQRPKVGEPRRMSTATSKISPRTARTSLPCGRRSWAWSPRSVRATEREWLSCTKTASSPPWRYFSRW